MTPLYPQDPAYPRGAKRVRAIEAYAAAYAKHGYEHDATQGALGRLWYHYKRVPQDGVKRVAWERASGRTPGYMNRHARRNMRRAETVNMHMKEAA